MLLGACWLADPRDEESIVFRQFIVDRDSRILEGLGSGPVAVSLEEAVGGLVVESERARRHLVSWSSHDAEAIRTFTTHTAFRHRNAIVTARRWRRGRTTLGSDCPEVDFSEGNQLQSYLQLIGYHVPPHLRSGAGVWMQTIEARLAGTGGDVSRLSPGGKQAWTNLVDHNRHDVLGLRAVVLAATGVQPPACLG